MYLGDTSATILENDEIYKYPCIFIECTFLLDDEYDRSKEVKHMHWRDLNPTVVGHPSCVFYLYHFSQRYKKEEIISFFLNYSYPNIILLAGGT